VVVRGRHRGKWKKSLVKKEPTGQNGNGRALVMGDEKQRGALPPLPNKASVSAPTTTLVPDEPEKIVRESTSVGRWTKPCTTRRNSLVEVKEGVLLLCSEKPPPAPPISMLGGPKFAGSGGATILSFRGTPPGRPLRTSTLKSGGGGARRVTQRRRQVFFVSDA